MCVVYLFCNMLDAHVEQSLLHLWVEIIILWPIVALFFCWFLQIKCIWMLDHFTKQLCEAFLLDARLKCSGPHLSCSACISVWGWVGLNIYIHLVRQLPLRNVNVRFLKNMQVAVVIRLYFDITFLLVNHTIFFFFWEKL